MRRRHNKLRNLLRTGAKMACDRTERLSWRPQHVPCNIGSCPHLTRPPPRRPQCAAPRPRTCGTLRSRPQAAPRAAAPAPGRPPPGARAPPRSCAVRREALLRSEHVTAAEQRRTHAPVGGVRAALHRHAAGDNHRGVLLQLLHHLRRQAWAVSACPRRMCSTRCSHVCVQHASCLVHAAAGSLVLQKHALRGHLPRARNVAARKVLCRRQRRGSSSGQQPGAPRGAARAARASSRASTTMIVPASGLRMQVAST